MGGGVGSNGRQGATSTKTVTVVNACLEGRVGMVSIYGTGTERCFGRVEMHGNYHHYIEKTIWWILAANGVALGRLFSFFCFEWLSVRTISGTVHVSVSFWRQKQNV